MVIDESQDPVPGKSKNHEYQISKYGHKDARNAAPAHSSVL